MKRVAPWAAAAVFILHLAANPHYGYFRDELYFIICGRHPQWGYVDQPPIVPLLAALTQAFGHSLVALRAIPALFAAGAVYVTCDLAQAFGGGRFAQLLAAVTFALTPVLLSFGMKVGTDEVGLFTWPFIALVIVRLTRGADPRRWIAAGIALGMSFESKYSVLFFAVALAAGLAFTPQRRILADPWCAAGLVLAAAIALPNVLWQLHSGLPMLELLRNGQNGKNLIASPPVYVVQEIIITGALIAPVWMIGWVWLWRRGPFRFLAIAYGVLILEMLILRGKHYYPASVYPILIAAGAVPIEAWCGRWRPARVLVAACVVMAGAIFVPDALPVLPERTYIAYAARRNALFHFPHGLLATEHGREESSLPGDWADMHGWPEMAARAAAAYRSLSPAQRRDAIVFAGNYGEASAVAFFAPDVPVVSEHNQFWLWGLQGARATTLVQINGSCFWADHLYGSRTRVATLHDAFALAYENDIPIWVCRDPKKSLAALWPQIKDYE